MKGYEVGGYAKTRGTLQLGGQGEIRTFLYVSEKRERKAWAGSGDDESCGTKTLDASS